MRFLLAAVACVSLIVAPGARPAAAQDLGDREIQTVARYERMVWNGWVNHNPGPLHQFLAPDYRIVTEEGLDAATTLETIIANFDKYQVGDAMVGPITGEHLAPDVLMLSYRAHVQSAYQNRDTSREIAVASIWIRRDGMWVSVLSHQVKVGP